MTALVASVPSHSFVALNDLKVPVKIAQEQLGHASIATTLNVYTHLVDGSHRKAVEAVEQRLVFELDPNGPESANAARTTSPTSSRNFLRLNRKSAAASAGGKS
jgi:hypothetical protein